MVAQRKGAPADQEKDTGPWFIGKTVGKIYEIRDVLGRGGMGIVYRGYNTATQWEIAVKVPLGKSFVDDEAGRKRFTREAEAWSGLVHPHIVHAFDVHDDETTDYRPAVLMDFCDGGSLAEWLQNGPGTAVGDLANGWKTTVEKEPFESNATNLSNRAGDWARWNFEPNNIVTKSTFDHTVHEPNGTTRVQIQRQQTGYGYEPGKTRIYERTRTEFRGNRVETIGGGTQGRWNSGGTTWYRGNTQSGPSRFGASTQSRPSFGGSSFSRPSFSSPSRSFH